MVLEWSKRGPNGHYFSGRIPDAPTASDHAII
jgi:hypothetical protein